MISKIHNQNFGYSVACDSYWAAVGNPSVLRYNSLTGSIIRTGSVEVYKYNINTDIHDLKTILYRPLTSDEVMLLSTEYANTSSVPQTGPYWYIHTEYTGSVPITADKDLLVDVGQYYSASGDGYGFALDIKDDILAVGCPYFTSRFTFETQSYFYTGTGYVDIFDLSKLNIDPYVIRTPPIIIGSSSVDGFLLFSASVAVNQDYRFVYIQTKNTTIPDDNWQNIVGVDAPSVDGNVFLQTNYTVTDIIPLEVRAIAVIGTNPYLTTIYNPNQSVTESFGWSVSLNDEWLAVGSPLESGSRGSVFMFRKMSNDNASWSFAQSLPLPLDIGPGDGFGSSIEVNKATSFFSWSMVVGSNKLSSSRVYIYEYDGNNWSQNFTLYPDNTTIYPLPFYPTKPLIVGYPNHSDWFGYDVSMYEDSVMVGAPKDRVIQEYEGSSFYEEGAVYFFQRCPNRDRGYYFVRKSYGNEKIMKDNMLGWSVSIRNPYAVAGIPKINILSSSVCYLRGSLFQEHYCESSAESSLQGQFILFNENTSSLSSIDWDIVNIYQVKKRYLSPYRDYGWDIDICEQFIIVGSPMLISGSNTTMAFYKESPLVPMNLTVVSSSALLNWTYDYEYSEQDGFNIEKSFDGNNYSNIYILNARDNRSFTDTDVYVNATYWYRVNAYNDVGISSYSNVASIFFPPPAPSGLIGLTVHSGSSTGPSVLDWTFTGNYQEGFNIERSLDGITYNPYFVLANSSSRTYSDAAISVDNTYWYRVNVYNGTGISGYSNTASIYYPIPVPTGTAVLTVNSGSSTGPSVLNWTYANTTQTGWNIERSLNDVTYTNIFVLANSASRTYSDAAVSVDDTYWYKVQPYNGFGTGSYSNTASIYYLIPVPTGPTVLSVATGSMISQSLGSGSSVLNWTYANTTQTGWNIEKSSSATSGFINIMVLTNPSSRSYVDQTINANNDYWYKVQPYNGFGTGSLSNSESASFSNVLYFSGSPEKYYIDPTGIITETYQSWKLCSGCGNINLTNLYVYYNSLTKLSIISASALIEINCSYNQLSSSLDVSSNTNLSYLRCSNNSLTGLNLNSGSSLATLYCDNNSLTSLNVTSCSALSVFNCGTNQLTTMDVTHNMELSNFITNNNLLTTLDVRNNHALQVLDGDSNLLSTLYISGSPAYYVTVVNNQLTTASVSFKQCLNLSTLLINTNLFNTIDIGPCSASLAALGISSNPLYKSGGIFDATPYVNVSALYAANCGITDIDLTQCNLLTNTELYANEFPTVDFSYCPQLLRMDVSINSNLRYLDLSSNPSCSAIGAHELYSLTHFSASISSSYINILGDWPIPVKGTASMNQLYLDLDGNGLHNGTISALGTTAISGSQALNARTSLISKGWNIDDTYGILTYNPSSSLIKWTDKNGSHSPTDLYTFWATSESSSVTKISVGSGSNGGDKLISLNGLRYLRSLKTASVYGNSLTTLNVDNCFSMSYLSGSDNLIGSAQIDYTLVGLVVNGVFSGSVYIDKQTPSAPPTTLIAPAPNGLAATSSLKLKKWTVVTD